MTVIRLPCVKGAVAKATEGLWIYKHISAQKRDLSFALYPLSVRFKLKKTKQALRYRENLLYLFSKASDVMLAAFCHYNRVVRRVGIISPADADGDKSAFFVELLCGNVARAHLKGQLKTAFFFGSFFKGGYERKGRAPFAKERVDGDVVYICRFKDGVGRDITRHDPVFKGAEKYAVPVFLCVENVLPSPRVGKTHFSSRSTASSMLSSKSAVFIKQLPDFFHKLVPTGAVDVKISAEWVVDAKRFGHLFTVVKGVGENDFVGGVQRNHTVGLIKRSFDSMTER